MLIPNRMGANIGKRASPNSAVADSQDVPRRNFDGRGSSGRISLGMSAYFSITVMYPKSEVSINTRDGSLLTSKLLPRMTEFSPRAFGTAVGLMRYVISPALLMPIRPAILFEGSLMLDSRTEGDQVSQFLTGTSERSRPPPKTQQSN